MSRILVISSLTVYHGDEILRSWSWHWQAFQGERLVIQGTDGRTDTHTPTTGANLDIYRSGWFGLLAILHKTKALWFHEMLKRQFKDLQQKAKLDSQEVQRSFSSEISWALLFFSPSTYSQQLLSNNQHFNSVHHISMTKQTPFCIAGCIKIFKRFSKIFPQNVFQLYGILNIFIIITLKIFQLQAPYFEYFQVVYLMYQRGIILLLRVVIKLRRGVVKLSRCPLPVDVDVAASIPTPFSQHTKQWLGASRNFIYSCTFLGFMFMLMHLRI